MKKTNQSAVKLTGNIRQSMSRRKFVKTTASAAAFSIVPASVLGKNAPSNKLNIAAIGVGGQGGGNLRKLPQTENIAALCDVDMIRAKGSIATYPDAKVFRDYRVMFDKMSKDIDAVIVSTPDHSHYGAVMSAIEKGKHVYCEKPLAHSVYEVRKIGEAARKAGVMTQMGNQGHSSDYIRECCELIWDGVLGDVHEVRAWSNRPQGGYAFPSSLHRPTETPPVPDTLDWDLWLGPAEYRPYHPIYAPIFWRSWFDFGTGALGDMGCHILDPACWALNLGAPTSVEAAVSYNPDMGFWSSMMDGTKRWKEAIKTDMQAMNKETIPASSIIRYEFPARDGFPPLKLSWHDGGLVPERPELYTAGKPISGNGALIIGEKGVVKHGSHGAAGLSVYPDSKKVEYENNKPKQVIERVSNHHQEWVDACKGGKPSISDFEFGSRLTEMVLIGVAALRVPGKKLLWDGEKMAFINSDEANEFINPGFREGWKM